MTLTKDDLQKRIEEKTQQLAGVQSNFNEQQEAWNRQVQTSQIQANQLQGAINQLKELLELPENS